MPRIKLTQLTADKLGANDKEVTYWDTQCPGFGVRVSPRGRKTWVAMYRVAGGKERMETLGTIMTIPNVGRARDLARLSMTKARSGVDPVGERKAAEAAAAIAAFSFADLVERYVREYAEVNTKPATVYETRRILGKAVALWGERPARSITKANVNSLIEEIAGRRLRNRAGSKGGPLVEANAVLRCLKTLARWAVAKDLIDSDPTAGVLKPLAREVPRDRVLDDREIVWFWQSAEMLGWPFGPIAKLLLLTAQRESEVAGMRWSEIDLAQQIWTIPSARAKNGKAHIVHLSPLAMEVIAAVPNLGDPMFSTNGNTPVSGFSNAKERIDKFMNSMAGPEAIIARWVWHDLRRTATTGMARLGIAPHVADKVLNHSTGTIRGVAAVYNRHAYLDERKSALNAWARFVEELVRPDSGGSNVVPLRA